MKRYMAQAEKGGEVRLLRASEALLQAESRLKNMALPRVLVESVLVRIARPEEQRTVEDLVERIEALEQRPVAAAQPASVLPWESQPVPQAQMEDLPPGGAGGRTAAARAARPFRRKRMVRNSRLAPSLLFKTSCPRSPRQRKAQRRSGPRWQICWIRITKAWLSWPGPPSGFRWRAGPWKWALTARCFATLYPSRQTWLCSRRCCNRCSLERYSSSPKAVMIPWLVGGRLFLVMRFEWNKE